jgi:pimeloyl-ACP methyl ester carboxylesterase
MYVGGRPVTLSGLPVREIVFTPGAPPFRVDPNGDFETDQMYVQWVKLANPSGRYPILMIHGGGLSGVTWETKPDGNPGWQSYFLKAGYDVYVADAVERGRASWSRYPEIFKTDPAKRKSWPETQFPTAAFDQFMKQGVPRWSTNDAATQRAYDELVQKICPCVIIVHSQGGNFAFNAALKAPDKVRAIAAIEPSGSPDPGKTDLKNLKGVPHLFVWGDRLDTHDLWRKITPAIGRYRDGLIAVGTPVTEIKLPERGVRGNTHMLMMDRNSDEIAGLVKRWFDQVAS